MKLSKRTAWLLVGLTVALLAAAAFLFTRSQESVDQGAVEVARQEADNFFSLDYRHVEDDVDRVLSLATGRFEDEYAAKRDEVIAGVKAKKLIVTATVPDDGAAVEYLHDDRAQILVAVDVSTNRTEDSRYRTRVTLSKVDGRWRVTDLEQVG